MFSKIEDAIKAIANGKMIIVVDDEDRENEGDLVMAAQFSTPDAINFMIKEARGLVCLPLEENVIDRLELKPMKSKHNTDKHETAFLDSIDANTSFGVTTGISASDRSKTIQASIKATAKKSDFVSPGHIFPLKAKRMGVLKRAGHTEAAVDLARLAGLAPAGIICEIIKPNGEMARQKDLVAFSKKHAMPMITIKDLIHYRMRHESFIKKGTTIKLPTDYGEFKMTVYKDLINEKLHFAIVKGEINQKEPVLVRVHSECFTGDIFASRRCDCGSQLHKAMEQINDKGSGIILYMSQEGRGIGIEKKLEAYVLQEQGLNTIEANEKLGFTEDLREYGVGAQILVDLGIKEIDLLTNNPKKIIGLEGYGLKIMNRVPIKIKSNKDNEDYLNTKKNDMGHYL